MEGFLTATLGQTIREARLGRELSLRALADLLGRSPSYLNDIEHNRRVPSEAVIEALAEALDLDADSLLAAAGRVGEDAEEYLRARPSAGVLLRKATEKGLSEQDLQRLISQVDRFPDRRNTTDG
jgi:transcriptional regulator with XRE-family HTH domain